MTRVLLLIAPWHIIQAYTGLRKKVCCMIRQAVGYTAHALVILKLYIKDSYNCETGMRGMITCRVTVAYRHDRVQGCRPTVAYRVEGDGINISY